MEEEAVAGAAIEAGIVATLSEQQIALKANDHKSQFRSNTALDQCSSCHTELAGRYCHHCGQVADTFHRPFWSLFGDIFDGLFGFDGRIWKTIWPLMVRPGAVTLGYLSGVRQPYIQPFRLFLATSIIFFLVFAIRMPGDESQIPIGGDGALLEFGSGDMGQDQTAEAVEDLTQLKQQLATDISPGSANEWTQNILQQTVDSIEEPTKNDKAATGIFDDAASEITEDTDQETGVNVEQDTFVCGVRKFLVPEQLATDCQEKLDQIPNTEDGKLPDMLEMDTPGGASLDVPFNAEGSSPLPVSLSTRSFLAENIETAIRDPKRYVDTISRWAPRLAFALVPVYGLLLAVTFFWRRKLFIYDHMIVALHFHAFIFLFLALLIPLSALIGPLVTVLLFLGWGNYYLYRMHRKVYACGRVSSVIRTLVLDFIYAIILTLALIVLLILGVLFV